MASVPALLINQHAASIRPAFREYLQVGEVLQCAPGKWVVVSEEPALNLDEEIRPRPTRSAWSGPASPTPPGPVSRQR